MVAIDQFTRRIIGFAVHAGTVDGSALCRMFNEILSRASALPCYLSSDHDPLFEFRQWQASLRILDVPEPKAVPYVPLSHPVVERLTGTLRQELLDQVAFWTARDLERKLGQFQDYYNNHRVHASLAGVPPDSKAQNSRSPVANLSDYQRQSHCRGLNQLPIAA